MWFLLEITYFTRQIHGKNLPDSGLGHNFRPECSSKLQPDLSIPELHFASSFQGYLSCQGLVMAPGTWHLNLQVPGASFKVTWASGVSLERAIKMWKEGVIFEQNTFSIICLSIKMYHKTAWYFWNYQRKVFMNGSSVYSSDCMPLNRQHWIIVQQCRSWWHSTLDFRNNLCFNYLNQPTSVKVSSCLSALRQTMSGYSILPWLRLA